MFQGVSEMFQRESGAFHEVSEMIQGSHGVWRDLGVVPGGLIGCFRKSQLVFQGVLRSSREYLEDSRAFQRTSGETWGHPGIAGNLTRFPWLSKGHLRCFILFKLT